MVNSQLIITIIASVQLLVGASGIVAATPGEGPPSDTPGVVPDFVSNILGSISDFISGVLDAVFSLVERITPGAAEDGVGTANESVHG